MGVRKVKTNCPCVLEMMCYTEMHLQIKHTKNGSVMWRVHLVRKYTCFLHAGRDLI